jgi:hypothetical protein
MPLDRRIGIMRSWYQGDRAFDRVDAKNVFRMPDTNIRYQTEDPKREFVERVVEKHLLPSTRITFDAINYHKDGREVPMPRSFKTVDDIVNGFRALTAPGTGFITHVTNSGVNLLYVRVRNYEGEDRYLSIVINRWHDNVNSMFGEDDRLDPAKDTMDFLLQSVGAYPNYFFEVDGSDLPEFFEMLKNFDGSDEYDAKFRRYGVNRADGEFWESYDRFQARLDTTDPLHAGLYDLNRYYPVAQPSDGAQ